MADVLPDKGLWLELVICVMTAVSYDNTLLFDPVCSAIVISIVLSNPMPEFKFLHVTLVADIHELLLQFDFPADTELLNPDDPRPYTVNIVEPLLGALLFEIDEAKSQANKDRHIQPLG